MLERTYYSGKYDFVLNQTSGEEQKLSFSSKTSPADVACIGHLRGDFDSNGVGFFTTWFPHHDEMNTPQFREEIDALVNTLRKAGLLENFSRMSASCRRFPDSRIKFQSRDEYAFRLDSGQHTYYLRCIPMHGDYNFYLYCYDRAKLLEAQRAERGMPLRCWAALPSTGELIEIHYGENGYHPQRGTALDGMTGAQIAAQRNAQCGYTKAQVRAMETGSLFGWQVPGADARNYDDNGRPQFLAEQNKGRKLPEAER